MFLHILLSTASVILKPFETFSPFVGELQNLCGVRSYVCRGYQRSSHARVAGFASVQFHPRSPILLERRVATVNETWPGKCPVNDVNEHLNRWNGPWVILHCHILSCLTTRGRIFLFFASKSKVCYSQLVISMLLSFSLRIMNLYQQFAQKIHVFAVFHRSESLPLASWPSDHRQVFIQFLHNWLVIWNMAFMNFHSVECHHPNWRSQSYFSEG